MLENPDLFVLALLLSQLPVLGSLMPVYYHCPAVILVVAGNGGYNLVAAPAVNDERYIAATATQIG